MLSVPDALVSEKAEPLNTDVRLILLALVRHQKAAANEDTREGVAAPVQFSTRGASSTTENGSRADASGTERKSESQKNGRHLPMPPVVDRG